MLLPILIFNIEFTGDDEIRGLKVLSECPRCRIRKWEAYLTVEDLRKLVEKLVI